MECVLVACRSNEATTICKSILCVKFCMKIKLLQRILTEMYADTCLNQPLVLEALSFSIECVYSQRD